MNLSWAKIVDLIGKSYKLPIFLEEKSIQIDQIRRPPPPISDVHPFIDHHPIYIFVEPCTHVEPSAKA